MHNEVLPRNNPQKHSDTKIEDSHPYIAELTEKMPKYRIFGILQANFYWGINFILCTYVRNINMNYIIMITIKTSITPFILFTLVAYIAVGISVKKNALYLTFLPLIEISLCKLYN